MNCLSSTVTLGTTKVRRIQHDVYSNKGAQTRLIRPYLIVLQADFVEGDQKLVCPLFRSAFVRPSRLAAAVDVLGEDLVVGIQAMFGLRANALRQPVASIADDRDDIVRALDWLFTGV